jgi:AcrR family transcriptional regulator
MESLRERKKQRTREALIRAALELFTTRGYEGTTVDDITEAVEVSQRTFFRYFASKEEVALAPEALTFDHLIEAVRTRPAHETPMEALHQAVLDGWDRLSDVITSVVPVELFLRMYRVVESTPVLLAAHLRRSAEIEDRLARVIAEREGVDVDADPRPRITVAVFSGVMRVVERRWNAIPDGDLDTMRAITEAYLGQVGPALTGNWRED